MGLKRWLLALLILVVVLGFIFFFFLQSGADQKIAEVVIPRIEEKLNVTITYESVSVSLTSVSFTNVKVFPGKVTKAPKKRELPFVVVERLGVHFRVGPLLLGNLDLTGIRVDGVHLRVGKGARGASIAQWQALAAGLRRQSEEDAGQKGKGKAKEVSQLKVPDVYVVSGDVHFNDSRMKGALNDISGRVTPGNKAVLQTKKWEIRSGKEAFVKADSLEVEFDFSLNHLELDVAQPTFVVPASKARVKELAKNMKGTMDELGLLAKKPSPTQPDAPVDDTSSSYLDVVARVHSANGEIIGNDGKKALDLQNVNLELLSSQKMVLSARASGGVSGTDARWAMQGAVPRSGDPSLVIEVPDLPLKNIGRLVYAGTHVDWSKASVDGEVKLVFQEGGAQWLVEGQTSLAGLGVSHERIADEAIRDFEALLDYRVVMDFEKELLHLERVQVSRDLARMTFRGELNLSRLAFDMEVNVPDTSCRQILDSIPEAMRAKLAGVDLEGRIGMALHVAFDALTPDDAILDGSLDNRCKISKFGSVLHPDDLRRPFAYMAYDEKGNRIRLTTGPGTNRWTPYSRMSPFLTAAALTTEDGKFEYHKGITLPEIRNAFLMNLKKEGMFHGGSTITMQLAKNLFLSRERTVARKLQEMFFVWYLESNFTKQEILELYFNVIEFGPSIYGVGEAAIHYFGRDASELNLLESVFLIKLLPNPVARHSVWEKGNTLSERRMKALHRVLATMRKRKRITEGEYNEAMRQTISFYKEGMPLPEPRMPVQRTYAGGNGYYEEDAPSFNESAEESW